MNAVFYAFVAVVLAWLLTFLLGRRLPWPLLLALGVSPVVLIYAFNPEFRVYSFHSFMHAGITYQILNGNIPPPDPLVAGHTVPYPWAAHLVAAGISRAFNVTPFLAIAALNVVSLALCLVLVYRISALVVRNHRANVLSAVVAVYAVTFTNPSLMKVLSLPATTEFRGVPLLLKFITINVLPLGLVCFLLFVHSVLRLEATRRLFPHAAIFLVSVLGVGFLYPAFLPAVGLSLALAWTASLALFRREPLRWSLVTVASTVAGLVIGVALARPYLGLLTAGTVGQMQVLVPRLVAGNLIRYLVVTAPILAVILVGRKAFRTADVKALAFLALVAAGGAAGYLAIHLNMDNEYKLLLLSAAALGIPGGIAFGHLAGPRPGWRTAVVFAVLAAFLFPTFRFVRLKLVQERAGRPSQEFLEKGRSIRPAGADAAAFYQWIKDNTDPHSAFIDRQMVIPVLAERALFVPIKGDDPRDRKGFGPVDLILRLQSGYPEDLINGRRTIAGRIYEGLPLTGQQRQEIRGLGGDLYVVLGPGDAQAPGNAGMLTEAAASPSGQYKLYKVDLAQDP